MFSYENLSNTYRNLNYYNFPKKSIGKIHNCVNEQVFPPAYYFLIEWPVGALCSLSESALWDTISTDDFPALLFNNAFTHTCLREKERENAL